MNNSIKSISIEKLQTAFAMALAELTGKNCTASIDALQFDDSIVGHSSAYEAATLAMKITLREVKTSEKPPF